MKHVRLDESAAAPMTDAIFVGDVMRQPVVNDDEASLLRVAAITFKDGARNKLHHHGSDQVLVITSGKGIVASESQHFEVSTGDIVLVPAGERHWHGAAAGKEMTHLSILTPGPMTIDE